MRLLYPFLYQNYLTILSWIILNLFLYKRLVKTCLLILITLNSYCQTSVSYKELTPLLGLIKNHFSSNTGSNYDIENRLKEKVLDLKWDLNSDETFEKLYQEVKAQKIDYRYFLIIAKATDYDFRKGHIGNNQSYNIINYYYKALFLNLAIENSNRQNRYSDTLKFEYTKRYILSTLEDSCFPSYNEFKEFADLNIKYCNELLNGISLRLEKDERSVLYYIIGDAIYRKRYNEEKDNQSLSNAFKYLSLAIKEDPKNWRAISDRADYKKDNLSNYQAAVSDYLLLLNVFEVENKKNIISHNKWLSTKKNIVNKKSFYVTRPTFETIMNIVECYLKLDDYKNSLLWLNKAIVSIKEYQEYNTNSEYASNYEGWIYYFKAYSHLMLKDFKKACDEVETAINHGYDIEECKKLQLEMNCNSNLLPTNGVTSIPMKKKGGVYEIPVTINNVLKLDFIFDAGAADVSISPDVALTLIRTGTVKDEDFLGSEIYQFADGSTAKSKVFIIREIELGDKKVNNVKASISKSINAPLLLGQSVLSKFGKVTIDYDKGVIIFQN